ncbi:MAG: hypothetical protein Q9219_003369 [cf. Caloplaca sp. 3 TL-2023]
MSPTPSPPPSELEHREELVPVTGPDTSKKDPEKTIANTDPQSTHVKQDRAVESCPNGGYGWVCVACCFWVNAHTWGINSSYGVFLAFYLGNDYYPGASALDFAFVGGLSISMALLISPIATTTTRLYGTNVTLLIGVFFETLALIGASFTHQIWQLFLSQGVCFGWGMGYLFVGSVGVVPQWFTTKRSFANGIATAGSGIGGLMYSLATNAMIESLGVGWAFRILGILAFTVNFICAILIRDRNKAIGSSQLAFDYTLFTRIEYLLTLGWGFFSMLGYIVLLFSLPSYAISVGLSPKQGSIVGALLNLGQGLGRPCVGIFSDSAGRINIAGFLTYLLDYDCTCGGRSCGLEGTPFCIVDRLAVAEPIALELRQRTGNIYLHAQIFTGLMYVAAALCMWFLRAWKIGQIEGMAVAAGKSPAEIDALAVEPSGQSASTRALRSNIFRRLCSWKRV